MNKLVVLVTGASGFVGQHLESTLVRDGCVVRRVVRARSGPDDGSVIREIGPATDWQSALVGVDTVVHLAARVHRQNDEHNSDLYQATNTEGTLRLANAAADAGVRQFIFVSTVLVHGRTNDGRAPFSENDSLTPRGWYGLSKAAAELGLERIALESGMGVTIVRPPLVYGAGAKGNFSVLVKAVKLGIPLPFASIRNRRAFVSVQNLTSFIFYQILHPGKKFDVFLLADDEQVSTPEFIRQLAKAAGAPSRLFPLPMKALDAVFKVSGRMDAHDSLIGSLELDLSKAASTGWRPELTQTEGLCLALREQPEPH
jgi:UDP-glucose 4-epimerase